MAAILSLVLSQIICLSSLPQFLQQQKKKTKMLQMTEMITTMQFIKLNNNRSYHIGVCMYIDRTYVAIYCCQVFN